ncbi:hypothetical protein ABZ202_12535 [Streptomyces sp. NPDC006186]|jgi:hypothetical protein|uniref:Uncharacterized protein n=1 Tax=Streptomyces thermocoprophilus TaxID=78356 RepID=A0ABV5V6V1_9ACTN
MRCRKDVLEALQELKERREQLRCLDQDPMLGLRALHDSVTDNRRLLGRIDDGVSQLRSEDEAARHRLDLTNSGLNGIQHELRGLRELVESLRPLVAADSRSSPSPEPEPADDGDDSAAARPTDSSDTASQGGTMENSEASRAEQGREHTPDQDLALKRAIETGGEDPGGSDVPPDGDRAQSSSVAQDPQVEHGRLLLKAAGVSSVELIAHHHTWEWLLVQAIGQPHFRISHTVEDFGAGRIRTVLSGRSLIALLLGLWNTRCTAAALEGDWPLAVTSYQRIAAGLAEVCGQGETVRIVLDDGLPNAPRESDG